MEQGETPLQTAQREAEEETGQVLGEPLMGKIFDVDVHPIPFKESKSQPAHFHHDIDFLFQSDNTDLTISDESTDIRWVPLVEIAAMEDEALRRRARKTEEYLASLRR